MRLIEKAFEIAKAELKDDWKEIPGIKSNPRILEAYKCVDGLGNPEMLDDSKIAWCSVYANYCIQKAGGKGTRSAAARSWLDWGNASKGKVGDIVVFKRGTGWQGHVAFVLEIGPVYITCVGGNQGDDVTIHKYLRLQVLGYRTSKD
jgi:uncharacterized protein (TIGR02594 family)